MGPIGFLGADWWGSDARATAAELRRRGLLLIERHYEDYLPTRWRSVWLRALRRGLRPLIEHEYNRAVQELLSVQQLEFLLVFKGMLLHASTLKQFREKGVPLYCVYPDVSFEDHGANITACLPVYDCVFTTKSWHLQDPGLQQRFQQLQLVPHGYDPEVHRPVPTSSTLQRIYGCDASFVGAWSAKKQQFLRVLIEQIPQIDLKIWGPAWGAADAVVRRFWQGRGAWGDETAAIYGCSRINLGLLSEAGTGTTSGDLTTARTWQIPASGGFLLHEDTEEVRKAFKPGEEIGVFRGASDLGQQTAWWLAHPEARAAAAQRARVRAQRDRYTYGPAVDAVLAWHAGRSQRQ
jgi:hypothetical protein